MRKSISFLALAAFWSSGAGAQIPTSTHDRVTTPIDPTLREIARTDDQLREMVACIVRRQPGRTRTLLDTVPGSDAEERILFSFESRMNSCYNYARTGRSMSLTTNLLRAAIAEFYYRRDFAQNFAAAAGAEPAQAEAWTQPRVIQNRITQSEALHSMARCVVVRQPMIVRDLLAAPPLSAEEGSGFSALHGDLAACLLQGFELTASRQALRGLLAEAAFHYAAARSTGFVRLAGQAVARPAQ